MKIYCLVCNEEFEADVATCCPHCGAVGDDLEPCDEEPTPVDYSTLTLHQCQDRACTEFGFDDPHTFAIAKLVDLVADDHLTKDEATIMALIIYHHGTESLRYNEGWDEEEEPDCSDEGYDPYMGCYTGDC